MTKSCTLCRDPRRNEIDKRLLNMEISKESFRQLSSTYLIHESSLRRHKKNCLGPELIKVQQAVKEAKAEALAEVKAKAKAKTVADIGSEAKVGMAARLENASCFLDQIKEVRTKAANLLDQAEASMDLKAAGTFLKELREQIRLMAELEGKLAAQPQVTIINNPEWIEIRTIILQSLDPYPEAKEAMIVAIHGR